MILNEKNIGEVVGLYECEFGEEAVFTIIKRDSKLIAGTICNAGLIEEYDWNLDKSFSTDENLNDFIEYINEEEERRI